MIADAGDVQRRHAEGVVLRKISAVQDAQGNHIAHGRLPRIAGKEAHVERQVAEDVTKRNVLVPHARILVVDEREQMGVTTPSSNMKRC